MDSQNKINIGASSSLIELKAELLRKQQELNQQKLGAKGVPKTISKTKERAALYAAQKNKKNAGIDKRNAADLEKLEEERMTHEKSRAILEQKAKLYEKMTAEALDYDETEHPVLLNALVNFQQKAVDQYHGKKKNVKESDEDEYVEFVDTLGRTRKCHKSELAQAIAQDEKLAQDEEELKKKNKGSEKSSLDFLMESGSTHEQTSTVSYSAVPPPTALNLTKTLTEEQVKEIAHAKWQEEQDKAEAKDFVHYQDVLYDEIRTHGVAYFNFANDNQKRAEQIRELKTLSEQTKLTREKVTMERQQKDSQLQERLRKVKEKKRARLGLPPKKEPHKGTFVTPEEESDETAHKHSKIDSYYEDREDDPYEKPKVEIRPWDFGKPGVYGPKPTNFDELDAKWLKDRRQDRNDDFAPPPTYYTKNIGPGPKVSSTAGGGSFAYSNFVRPQPQKPPMTIKKTYTTTNIMGSGGGVQAEIPQWGPSPSASAPQNPVPIENFMMDDDLEARPSSSKSSSKAKPWKVKGVEIAPPPTFEYYHGTHQPHSTPYYGNPEVINEAIAAGLRALRKQHDSRSQPPSPYTQMPGSGDGDSFSNT